MNSDQDKVDFTDMDGPKSLRVAEVTSVAIMLSVGIGQLSSSTFVFKDAQTALDLYNHLIAALASRGT